MRKYLIDQILFLAIGISIMFSIPRLFGPTTTIILEVLVITSWGYHCRRMLLLPIDCLLGALTTTAYFATQCSCCNLEFMNNTKYPEWRFLLGNKKKVRLFIPFPISKSDAHKVNVPPHNTKLRITYYPLSKILLRWELL